MRGSRRPPQPPDEPIWTDTLESLETLDVAPPPPQPLELETISSQWQVALDAAQSALSAAAGSLPAPELRRRRTQLGQERLDTAQALTRLARVNRVDPAPWLSPVPVSNAAVCASVPCGSPRSSRCAGPGARASGERAPASQTAPRQRGPRLPAGVREVPRRFGRRSPAWSGSCWNEGSSAPGTHRRRRDRRFRGRGRERRRRFRSRTFQRGGSSSEPSATYSP